MRAAVDAAGGDGAALSVLGTLPLTKAEQAPTLVEAGVTDFLVHIKAPDSYGAALDAYSEIVTAFAGAGSR